MDKSLVDQIPEQDLEDILAAIRDGATEPGDALGFGAAELNTLERMALAYYRAGYFPQAAVIFGFCLRMNKQRGSAWRGLGACAQALKRFVIAGACYEQALEVDPDDVPSRVFLAECQCQTGRATEALPTLKDVIAKGTTDPNYLPYVTRARALLAADGGIPASIVLRRQGQALVEESGAMLEKFLGGDELGAGGDGELRWEQIKQNTELREVISDLSKAVAEGRLTYAQVGGFTDDELDGAYAVSCQYCNMGEPLKAMQIVGYLIFLDPYKARYYQLAAICMQRLKHYESADEYYGFSLQLDKDDPMSWVYRGEARIMSGAIDAGVELVKKGLSLAGNKPEFKDLCDRGKVLVKQFARV